MLTPPPSSKFSLFSKAWAKCLLLREASPPPSPYAGQNDSLLPPCFQGTLTGALNTEASGLLQGQDCILLAASPPPGPGAGNALSNYSLVLLLTFRPCCQAEGALVFPASGVQVSQREQWGMLMEAGRGEGAGRRAGVAGPGEPSTL